MLSYRQTVRCGFKHWRVWSLAGSGLLVPTLASAQEASSTEAVELETVTVTGQGLVRSSGSITRQDLEYQATGVIPQAYLNSIPGVNVQLTDPYGLYEFGTSVRVRGFTSEQLAITLDGVPMEETPDTRDSTPPNRFVDTENLQEITVDQGSGDVTAPSFHALGGSIRYFTSDPIGNWRTIVSGTGGSDDMGRVFTRIDTPAWWDGGPIAYFSASRQSAVQWQNDFASMRTEHFSTKIRQDLDIGSLTLSYKYGKRDDHDVDAYLIDGSKSYTFTRNITGDDATDANFYDNWLNGRKDEQFSLNADLALTPTLKLSLIPYYEHKDGYGTAGVPYADSLAFYEDAMAANPDRTDVAAPVEDRFTKRLETMGGDRWGITGGFTLTAGNHEIKLGGWYQDYHFTQVRPLFNLDENGNFDTSTPPVTVYYDRDSQTDVQQFYIKDKITMFDGRFIVEAGTKGLYTKRTGKGYVDNTAFIGQNYTENSRTDKDYFQPQIGFLFAVTDAEEIFANYAENFSALPRLALFSSGYNPDVKPETSDNIDIGIRTTRGRLSGSLSLYHIAYKDRVLSLAAATGAEGQYQVGESIYQNVGDIETYGAELAAYWDPSKSFRLGSALSLNNSKFQDDYETADGVVSVKDKYVPDTPKVMLDLNATYKWHQFAVGGEAKYTGERYATTTNSEKTDAYTVVNINGSYKAGDAGPMRNVTLSLNVYNLLDEDYFGYITSVTAESGGEYNLGAPRQMYFTVRAEL